MVTPLANLSEMDYVFVKEPHVGTKTKISGIDLSEIYNERLKEIVENDMEVSSNQFDLVFGGRIIKEDRTPKEYKVISGSTVFLLKKFIKGDKSESSHKTAKNVRLPEFTELLRHERMQDLIVAVITDPNLVEHVTMESEEDAAALAHLKKLLRNRHFIGLLRSSTFEMFMNTPELLTIGQQVFDKCIADMQNNGQEIPDSDAQLVKMLEEYFSVDYMEEEEEVDVNTEHVRDEEVSQAVGDTTSGQQLPTLPPLPVPPERQQPRGLFTAEMLTSALQGSNTSSPISDPPTYSAEHSRSPPARFSHDDLQGALEGALRTSTTGNHQHSHHHRRSGYEVSRRSGHSSRREDGYELRRERQERRERFAPHRRESSRRPELPADTTAQLIQNYQTELEQLKLMGITDELLAVQILQATDGDVNTAAEILLQSQQ